MSQKWSLEVGVGRKAVQVVDNDIVQQLVLLLKMATIQLTASEILKNTGHRTQQTKQ